MNSQTVTTPMVLDVESPITTPVRKSTGYLERLEKEAQQLLDEYAAQLEIAGADDAEAQLIQDKYEETVKKIEKLKEMASKLPAAMAKSKSPNREPELQATVPPKLPLLQLTDEVVWDRRVKVFDSAHDFCKAFETTLRAHRLQLDTNWERLLPVCLSAEQISWFEEHLLEKNLSWENAKLFVLRQYDTPMRRLHLMIQVNLMEQKPGESVREYTYRFQKLRREADMEDNVNLAVRYLCSLHRNIQDDVRLAIASRMGTNIPTTVTDMSELVFATISDRQGTDKVGAKRAYGESNYSNSHVKPKKVFKPTVSNSKDHRHNSQGGQSQYHGPKQPTNLCRYCKKSQWHPGHKCREFYKDRKTTFTSRAAQKLADSSDELQKIDAMSLGKLKQKTVKKDFEETNVPSIFVPIIIQNRPVQALVDTGANFSSVSLSFCKQYNLIKYISAMKGEIQLADDNLKVQRIGTINLSVRYNQKCFQYNFEVMNLLFNTEISIGLDLMPTLGISLHGLAVSWDTINVNKDEGAITVPDDVRPNESPAGTKEDHDKFLENIKPFILRNQNIPTSSFCTIPESVITIDTPEGVTSYRRQYPLPESYHVMLRETIDTWLRNGTIKKAPVNTEWNSPLTFAPKKDELGNYTGKRPCLDPRAINKLIKDDRYPLPLVKDVFYKIRDSKIFSTLDLTSAFHRFKIAEDDQKKTTFTFDGDQYMFQGCPFGLKPISSKFQRVMNIVFQSLPFVTTFVDDIIVFSKSMEEHLEHVKIVISKLTEVNLILNPKKCHFAQKSVYLLGFCVDAEGVSLDPRKVVNVENWPVPQTGKDVQRFLGIINYFREHIPNIAKVTAPLDKLRNEGDITKLWVEKQQTSFDTLKKLLASAPILSYPVMSEPFYVATDASNVGIGAVLYQTIDGVRRFNAFMARSLTISERNYSTTKRELLAVVFAFKKFHKFIWGNKFTLLTDHKALTYLHTQKIANAMMITWLDTLLEYDFDIVHLPGLQNVLPDNLSRLFTPIDEQGGNDDQVIMKTLGSKFNKLSTNMSTNKITKPGVKTHARQLVTNIQASKSLYKRQLPYKIHRAAAIELNDVMTPPDKDRKELLEEAHLFGHFGAEAIVKSIQRKGINWKSIKDDALKTVNACAECQKFNIVKQGFNPLRPVSAAIPGDHWALDLAGPFKTSKNGNNYLMVLVDICTRFCILRALPDKQSQTIVKHLTQVFCDYGFPKYLQSDNGTEFVNELMELLAESAGFEHRLVTPYHPRANGVAERWVQTSVMGIKKRVQGVEQDWDIYVPSTQLAINAKVSKRTNTPPFTFMFGRNLNEFRNYKQDESVEPMSNDELLFRVKQMAEIVFPAISERTQNVIKKQKDVFDKSHKLIQYPPQSIVMIKNTKRAGKLEPSYEGPYTIVRVTQGGAYVLQDQQGELMPKNYPPSALKLISQDEPINPEDVYVVDGIVAHRKVKGKYEYKVRWKGYTSDHDTWEPTNSFTSQKTITEYWQRIGAAPETLKRKRA